MHNRFGDYTFPDLFVLHVFTNMRPDKLESTCFLFCSNERPARFIRGTNRLFFSFNDVSIKTCGFYVSPFVFCEQGILRWFSRTPKAVDVLITDISEEDLLAIAGNFKIERLKPPPPNFLITYPIKGRLFGWNNRVFFPMVIKKGEKKIALPMLYDTGSQYTFLRDDTLRALGIKGDIPMGAQVQINEFPNIRIFLSHSHFRNVDVFGQEFMVRFGLEVLIAPSVLKAKLMKVDPEEWDDSDD